MEAKWLDRAHALQLRIRDRVRVAVDRRRHWQSLVPDASHYCRYPPTLQRWADRLRSLLLDPSPARWRRSDRPSTSRFYLKRVGKDVDALDDSVIIRLLQAVAVPVLGNACHIFMHGLNRIQVYGAENLYEALLRRPQGKSLITVSNHVAAVDDPFVIASLLPPNVMLDARNIRWTLCATDRCFTNPVLSTFFRCVKVLPVSRGDGIYQQGMDIALSKLNNGGWVHIFPEGSRSRDGGRTIAAAKRGVGRLVMDADQIPIVVPFVHSGMQEIMPVGTHFPRTGKRVTVVVGDPIPFEDLLLTDGVDPASISRGVLYDAVSARITHRLQELKHQVDRLVLEQSLEVDGSYISNSERASGIWQQVDWEAFGWEGAGLSASTLQTSITRRGHLEASPQPEDPCSREAARPSFKMGLSYERGIVSRIRSYVNPSEFMGFAARGLFAEVKYPTESIPDVREVRPLRAWRSLLEANLLQKLNAF